MKAARLPIQRPRRAKLLAVDQNGLLSHQPRSGLVDLLRPGDLVIANDAATLPASLSGVHQPSGRPVEVRLAGGGRLGGEGIRHPIAVVFGAGDFRTRTEDRPQPPQLSPGDRLLLGSLRAAVKKVVGHPRLVQLAFEGGADEVWRGLARHGRPIQYSHIRRPLQLGDVWTPIAGPPAAFEPPSAGFALDWRALAAFRERGIRFATLTHAAGISSTGDLELDAQLPFEEPYWIPPSTARAVRQARAENGRVVAVGTTVVRALEHAAESDGRVRAGAGVATQRVGPATRLRVVDAIVTGTHEPGTSHYELMQALVDGETLRRIDRDLIRFGYLTHEFGDSVFVERMGRGGDGRVPAPVRCGSRQDHRGGAGSASSPSISSASFR